MGNKYQCIDCKEYFNAYNCHVCNVMTYDRCYWCHFDYWNDYDYVRKAVDKVKVAIHGVIG